MLRVAALVLVMAVAFTGCFWPRGPATDTEPDPDYARPEHQDLPLTIKEWANYSRTLFAAHAKVEGNRRYILVSYGEKPTTGYAVEIIDVADHGDRILVTIDFSRPDVGQEDAPEPVFPQDIVSIEDTQLPLEFAATGAEEFVPTLVGIGELPPIAAESQWIKVFSPSPDTLVEPTFSVRGVANVFEGTVNYRILGTDGTVLEDLTTAGMGDWHYFEFAVELPENISDQFELQLFTYSAEDGSITNLVQIPLTLEQAGN